MKAVQLFHVLYRMTRRHLLSLLAAAHARGQGAAPPVRAITKGPKYHWFGYYDKWQFDPTDRYVLGMEVDFEERSPQRDDVIRLGMIDLEDVDRWIELGESRAWCWQQGCMLQWLPGSKSQVIWNDREGDRYVSRILDVKTRERRTVPAPVYAISPDGKWAVSPDFRRLHKLRPGYGYAGIPDPNADVLAPQDAGIWRTDLRSGETELLIALSKVAAIPAAGLDTSNSKHWFNHLLVSPDGDRFIFLHRWQGPQHKTFLTRMFTCDPEGKEMYVLDPHGRTSHFIWRDAKHVLAWAYHPTLGEKFYLYRDKTQQVEPVGPKVMTVNGHCTYLPRTEDRWILNDTYPDKERLQHVYAFDTRTGKRVALGDFLSPREYSGEWRCDTHPRFSRDGRKVCIDSPHEGNGRQLYLIDVGSIVS
jgi:hypothetical protein